MKFFSSFSIAVTALLAHKTRTLLASLGILIGIASVIVMVAIGKGSQKEVMDVIADMGENMVTINAGEMKRRGGRLRLSGNVITLTPKDAERIADEIDAPVAMIEVHPTHERLEVGVVWLNDVRPQ